MFLHFRSFSLELGRISEGMLERSLSTNSRKKKSHVSTSLPNFFPCLRFSESRITTTNHKIITLNPNKFVEKKQQCLHIGNIQSFTPHILLLKHSKHVKTVKSVTLYYNQNYMTSMGKVTLYPPDTKAFLYYSMSPEKPRIAGELRLRVTSGNDPSFFESGSDLLQPDGVIWL